VEETAPACPACGEKLFVEHPADIQPTRHDVLVYPDEKHEKTPNTDPNGADEGHR
jgi:hypothetical protein